MQKYREGNRLLYLWYYVSNTSLKFIYKLDFDANIIQLFTTKVCILIAFEINRGILI